MSSFNGSQQCGWAKKLRTRRWEIALVDAGPGLYRVEEMKTTSQLLVSGQKKVPNEQTNTQRAGAINAASHRHGVITYLDPVEELRWVSSFPKIVNTIRNRSSPSEIKPLVGYPFLAFQVNGH